MNSKRLLGLGFILMLIYIIMCHSSCTSMSGHLPNTRKEEKVISQAIATFQDTITLIRVKVLENNTISYVMEKNPMVYQVGDTVWVDIPNHSINDIDTNTMKCVLLPVSKSAY